MAAAKKAKTTRGRKQDRARVAGKQDYEVRYEILTLLTFTDAEMMEEKDNSWSYRRKH